MGRYTCAEMCIKWYTEMFSKENIKYAAHNHHYHMQISGKELSASFSCILWVETLKNSFYYKLTKKSCIQENKDDDHFLPISVNIEVYPYI
jgi:hypothetical protein